MALFEVWARYSDPCGNEVQYFHCLVTAQTLAEVRAVYPEGAFAGWKVSPWNPEIKELPKTVQRPPPEKHFRGY